jgi:hypothetical protein
MSNETTLVNYLVKNLREYGEHVQRIENRMSSGVPDINFCGNHGEKWIEAKYLNSIPKNGVFDTGLNPQQINWTRARRSAGGEVFVVFRIKGRTELFCFIPWAIPCNADNGKLRVSINDCQVFERFVDLLFYMRGAEQ